MTDDTISPLRRRMIEDMTVRGFTACTQRGYIAAVRRFTVFVGRSPDQALADGDAFAAYLAPLHKVEWVVYAKRPFAGPEAVLAYLSRYTHRVAIANSRLIACDDNGVTFRWKDYRAKGRERHKFMTLANDEFIRRFLIHVLPRGFHPATTACSPMAGAPTTSPASATCLVFRHHSMSPATPTPSPTSH